MRILSFIIFILCISFSCTKRKGRSIYVREGQSINAAIQKCEGGDTVLIQAGVYREVINLNKSGICLKGLDGQKVVITGAERVTNWQKIRPSVYVAKCKKEVFQLFKENEMLLPARWPNFDSSMYSTSNWRKIYTSKDSAQFLGKSWPKNFWNGALVFAIAGKKWVVNVEQVRSTNDSVLKLRDKWFNYLGKWYTGEGEGFILKHLNALDTNNEWHWQNDSLFVFNNHQPEVLEAQTKEILLLSENTSNNTIQNITFLGGKIKLSNTSEFLLDKVNLKNGTAPKMYEYSNGYAYAALEILGESKECKILNSQIDGNWGGGIYLEGEEHLVSNCVVSNCNWMGNGTANIATNGYGHTISYCDVFNSGKFLILHNNTQRLTIRNNHLYNGGYLANDLGLTYCYRTDGDESEIAYNVVHGNYSKEAGVGIYIDMEGKKYLIHHNVVFDCKYGIQTVMNAYDHELYNNTIIGCAKAINYWGVNGSNMYNQKVYNNISEDIFDAGTDIQFNLSTHDKFFVDAAKHNFQLKKGAKAIDFGTYIPEITNEFVGERPDAGAFEYGLPAWKYGCDKKLLNKF